MYYISSLFPEQRNAKKTEVDQIWSYFLNYVHILNKNWLFVLLVVNKIESVNFFKHTFQNIV